MATATTAIATNPIVIQDKWGEVIVDFNGKLIKHKDCILTPTTTKEWDWNQDGTHYIPGMSIDAAIQLADCKYVILTRGRRMKLHVPPHVLDYFSLLGKVVYVLETSDAIIQYNSLAKKGRNVGALIHSSC